MFDTLQAGHILLGDRAYDSDALAPDPAPDQTPRLALAARDDDLGHEEVLEAVPGYPV